MSVDKTGSGSIAAGDVDIALHKAGRFGLGADILPEREGEASSNVDFETFLRLAAASIGESTHNEDARAKNLLIDGQVVGTELLRWLACYDCTVRLPASVWQS